MNDDLTFRLMFALCAAAGAMIAYVIGRYIIGPGNWNGT